MGDLMKTYGLKEAATILRMTPEGLRVKAKKGEIPGAKPGKCWCFYEHHLDEYLRTEYSKLANESQGVIASNRSNKWHSTNVKTSGGLISTMVEKDYSKALGLRTK